MFLWTLSVPPLAPPKVYGRLGGSFFLNAYQRLATLGEKSAQITILGKLILFKGTYNFLCKSNHVLVVISDFLCYFHPKIASVKLVKTPPKAMEGG